MKKSKVEVSRPVFEYFGGKFSHAKWIVSQFPEHTGYTEVFGGAASVLLRKPRSKTEVYNDTYGLAVNVFRVLRDRAKAAELERLIRLTPYAREEYSAAYQDMGGLGDVEMARRFIFRSFAGHASASAMELSGFRNTKMKGGQDPAKTWAGYPAAMGAISERLQGVIIENRNALELLPILDRHTVLHYVDPPYVEETRTSNTYTHDMTDAGQEKLAHVLNSLEGYVLLSGYHSDMYETLYKGWAVVKRKAIANGTGERVEVLYLNPAAAQARQQLTLF